MRGAINGIRTNLSGWAKSAKAGWDGVSHHRAIANKASTLGWKNVAAHSSQRGYAEPIAAGIKSYFSGPGSRQRIGVAAGGLVAAGTAGRVLTGNGGMLTDRKGDFDIAGIPFI